MDIKRVASLYKITTRARNYVIVVTSHGTNIIMLLLKMLPVIIRGRKGIKHHRMPMFGDGNRTVIDRQSD